MYTWSYLVNASLAKLDLTQDEATRANLTDRFYIYANEVITQVCSSIKPKYTFAEFDVTKDDIGKLLTMPDNFVSFGDDVSTKIYTDMYGQQLKVRATDFDFSCKGYNQVVFYSEGKYLIAYDARWFTFTDTMDGSTKIDVPNDILDCIPSYIAHQCYKIDDEVKASIFRNEYELFLSRIDNSHFFDNRDITIGGEW